jgi:hypothetical protein
MRAIRRPAEGIRLAVHFEAFARSFALSFLQLACSGSSQLKP